MKTGVLRIILCSLVSLSLTMWITGSPVIALSPLAGSTCQKLGAKVNQRGVQFQCQRKNNKLVWVTLKPRVPQARPLPVITSDDFTVDAIDGDLLVSIPNASFTALTANYGATSFIARFAMNSAVFNVVVVADPDNLDEYGALEIRKPSAVPGIWDISVAGINSSGQGEWSSSQQFTVQPDLQLVDPPNFQLGMTDGNLTATISAVDVQSSLDQYQTTNFVAQFRSPTGQLTNSTFAVQDGSNDALFWVTSPAPGTWTVTVAGINEIGQGSWSSPRTYVVPAPAVAPSPSLPNLNCGAPTQASFQKPGWIAANSSQLTTTWISPGVLQASWCPASVISTDAGYGPIIYTVTVDPGGETCTTWTATTCTISNVPSGASTTYLMATNEVGTNVSGIPTIANSGVIDKCVTNSTDCYPGPINEKFQAYGNTFAGLGDCTFAAAADWEQLNLGVNPDAATIGAEFRDAGGSLTAGLSSQALFSYWKTHGIAGVIAKNVKEYYTDQIDVQNGIRAYGELLAELRFVPGQNIAGNSQNGGGHMLVVDGFTPQGPVVVTWGTTLQMTWQQWNLEVTGLWGINN